MKEVINEVQVEDDSSLLDAARDRWITTKLRVRITLDKKIRAVNYSIETVNRHVYLMGISQNSDELERVFGYLRSMPYVRRIIRHVRLKNNPAARKKGA